MMRARVAALASRPAMSSFFIVDFLSCSVLIITNGGGTFKLFTEIRGILGIDGGVQDE